MNRVSYRTNDAIITICQDNNARSIEITEVNKAAEEMLGYVNGALAGKRLAQFLPRRIAGMLKEFVEFEPDGNDVGMVLAKVQSFSIIGPGGEETGYRLKVVRAESTREKSIFTLVLQDKTGLRKNELWRQAIQDTFKGHESLDPDTGLPDRQSLVKDIELMGRYSEKNDLRSCFAILQIDQYDDLLFQYGPTMCQSLIKHVAQIARQSLRPDDVVGSVNHKRIGILLLDTTPDSARVVINRLRWQIAANPFYLPGTQTTIGLSVSISFHRIGIARVDDKTVMDDCEDALTATPVTVVNALKEVG
jgi:diguanylate cyclase (GGDEF)-like protein